MRRDLVGERPHALFAVHPDAAHPGADGADDIPGVRGDEGRLAELTEDELVRARVRLVRLHLVHAEDPFDEIVEAGVPQQVLAALPAAVRQHEGTPGVFERLAGVGHRR